MKERERERQRDRETEREGGERGREGEEPKVLQRARGQRNEALAQLPRPGPSVEGPGSGFRM